MCNIKTDLVNKILGQIEKKMEYYNVIEYDGGVVLQNFDSWGDFISDTKTKEVKKIGDYSKNKNVMMIFAEKGTTVPITDFECSKTYIYLTGKIRLFFEDREDMIVQALSTMECDVPHGGEVLEDCYFIVIDET